MIWVMELSAAGMASFAGDADWMNPKTERVYRRLMMYIRRFGSAPLDERKLAELVGVTARYLRDRALPMLEDFFEYRDGRVFHPQVEALHRAAAARRDHARAAATARWEGQPALTGLEDASSIDRASVEHGKDSTISTYGPQISNEKSDLSAAPEPAMGSPDAGAGPHTLEHASSIDRASVGHAPSIDRASVEHGSGMPRASVGHAAGHAMGIADARAPARTLSLSEERLSSESEEILPTESVGGKESDGTPREAPEHAPGMPRASVGHTVGHGPEHAPGMRRRSEAPASSTRIPADWQPSPSGAEAARQRGYDPVDIADAFRTHYLANGEVRANWDAAFQGWLRRQVGIDAQRRQTHTGMAIRGGGVPVAVTVPTSPSPDDQVLQERLAAIGNGGNLDRFHVPSLGAFREMRDRGPEFATQADRWLAYNEAWVRAGRPAELTSPGFTHLRLQYSQTVQRLGELEEDLLTRPNNPASAVA